MAGCGVRERDLWSVVQAVAIGAAYFGFDCVYDKEVWADSEFVEAEVNRCWGYYGLIIEVGFVNLLKSYTTHLIHFLFFSNNFYFFSIYTK